jgi:hypothetical protein
MNRLTTDQQHALKTKLLLSGIRYRDVAANFGFSRQYVSDVLNGSKYDQRIVEYIDSLPVPAHFRKVISLIKQKKAA